MSARENAKIRLSNLTEGRDCQYKRHQYIFFNVTPEERKVLLTTLQNCKFNDEQDALLTACVTIQSIQQRRSRNGDIIEI